VEPGVYEWQDVYITFRRKVPVGEQIHREGAKELLHIRPRSPLFILLITHDAEE
jgi:hypothetical protein